jgi:hypothetical protein
VLARLDAARGVADMDLPGFRLHPLKGALKGFWAVTVRANWRVIFALPIMTHSTLIMWTTTGRREAADLSLNSRCAASSVVAESIC